MTAIALEEVLHGVPWMERSGGNPLVSDIVYDSRSVHPASVFVAMRGGTVDGNRFIENAIEQGATVIVTDSAAAFVEVRRIHPQLAAIHVQHGRRALAAMSANLFAHPEDRLRLSGVTGTNGKTTTTYLLDAMLRHCGRGTVLLGTVEYRIGGQVRPSAHTTPESRDIYQLLQEGVDAGATEAVMEVSSHALDQGRTWGLSWDTAVFTNLTQDHLDYHGTMEEYFAAKSRLFTGEGAAPPRTAIVHSAGEYGWRMLETARAAGCRTWTYALDRGDYHASLINFTARGTRFRMHTPAGVVEIDSRLAGPVNVLNLLAAAAAALARGLTLDQVAGGVEQIAHVPGRFQTVDGGQPFTVVIDYAHTEDALRNVTQLARQLAASRQGRVLTVFGCGGDRDRGKRPKMGRAAGEGSDFVVVTSDNPRQEDPAAILAGILPGIQSTGADCRVETDRAAAIRLALEEARDNDVVVIAGKGHEKVQILRDCTIRFDDAEVARQILAERFSTATMRGKPCD